MRKNKRLHLLNVKRQGCLLLLALFVLGVTSLGVWAGGPPWPAIWAENTVVAPDPHPVVGVNSIRSESDRGKSAPLSAATLWSIHFFAVPGADGTSLFVSTGQTVELGSTVSAQVTVGGAASDKGMSYNTGESAYEVLIGGIFTPGPTTTEGSIGLSSDLDEEETLETPPIPFRRFFVPTTGAAPLVSDDNNMEVTLQDDTLEADSYAIVMTTNSVPGPLPYGHQLLGSPYSIRASGAVITCTKPMLLKLFYSDTILGDIDPHTLSIFQWNPVSSEWSDLGGSLDDLIERSVSTTADRFTVYALTSAPRWRDTFSDFAGLSVRENVTILVGSSELIMNAAALTGTAISRLITPTVSIDKWEALTYTRTVTTGTSLTIDLLDAANNVLLSNVASGASLAALDPTLYPSLKLRANFSTDNLSKTPSLDEWQITWQAEIRKIYLPLILR
jgi:hypothetical protein